MVVRVDTPAILTNSYNSDRNSGLFILIACNSASPCVTLHQLFFKTPLQVDLYKTDVGIQKNQLS